MKKILILTDFYLPGYKAGGPIRTLASVVEQLGERYQFYIVTRDRDAKDQIPYEQIEPNCWTTVGKAQVFYLPPGHTALVRPSRLIAEVQPDLVYFNSFFSLFFSIAPLLLKRIRIWGGMPVIMAPRGEFGMGALAIHPIRKKNYLFFSRIWNLHANLLWQASSSFEETDLYQAFGKQLPVAIAPDLPAPLEKRRPRLQKKVAGQLKALFLARIAPIKNLDYALNILREIKGSILFNIYGVIDDATYWEKCQDLIQSLPPHIEVQYQGPIPNNQVSELLENQELLFLPTQGENFCHSVIEAMTSGCLVLISDQTPWRDLEAKGIGWDLPLDQTQRFREVLQYCIDMDSTSYQAHSESAQQFAQQYTENPVFLQQTVDLFQKALGRQ